MAGVNPDLVVRNKNGEIWSVRYDQINAMLLNEFLKEHKKVEKLEATIAQQQNSFESGSQRRTGRSESQAGLAIVRPSSLQADRRMVDIQKANLPAKLH